MKKPVLILLAIMLILAGSVIANAQNEAKAEAKQSWFDSFLGFFKSFFAKIFIAESKEPIITVNTSEGYGTNEAVTDEQKTGIANITNITCGYCQYPVNDTCLNYSCCQDSECNANETCIENECKALSCSSCQYAENHKCVNYECCKNEDCGINKTCVYNVCIDTAQECPRSCDDRTNWTIDYCNITTLTCEHIWIVPYCSNGICELDAGESNESCPADCEGVLEALYCTQDSDCVPACRTASWDGEKTIWGGRIPYGKCINKNYTCEDFPTLCDTHACQGRDGICITCNKCVNNQCVTTELDNNVWPPPCK